MTEQRFFALPSQWNCICEKKPMKASMLNSLKTSLRRARAIILEREKREGVEGCTEGGLDRDSACVSISQTCIRVHKPGDGIDDHLGQDVLVERRCAEGRALHEGRLERFSDLRNVVTTDGRAPLRNCTHMVIPCISKLSLALHKKLLHAEVARKAFCQLKNLAAAYRRASLSDCTCTVRFSTS